MDVVSCLPTWRTTCYEHAVFSRTAAIQGQPECRLLAKVETSQICFLNFGPLRGFLFSFPMQRRMTCNDAEIILSLQANAVVCHGIGTRSLPRFPGYSSGTLSSSTGMLTFPLRTFSVVGAKVLHGYHDPFPHTSVL